MKPLVSAGNAWMCTVTSIFAIVILSVIGSLFRSGHESMMGSINDPEDGKAVANTVFSAVVLYIVMLLFCGCQAWVHATQRQQITI
ncbi:hypothetical protein BDZ91DRAFT_698266 [Kalaharituber pfeilii]|nr:hypothetical protein BDZ91DRAFT_698266 [Kalaharituber pfeilii]